MTKKSRIFPCLNYILFIFLAVVTLYPLWYVFMGSVVPYASLLQSPFFVHPGRWSFAAYGQIFENKMIMPAFGLSVWTTLAGMVYSLVLTVLGAYVLSVRGLPYKKVLFVFVLFPMLFSGGIIPMYITLNSLGLINNPLVYILPAGINVFYLLVLKTSFQEIPPSLIEAADIDGCGKLKLLFSVILPLSLPALATVSLFYLVDKWSDLYSGIYYINSAKYHNIQVIIYNLMSATDNGANLQPVDLGSGDVLLAEQVRFACVIIATVPMLCIYPFLQKYFVKGVMLGSVKE